MLHKSIFLKKKKINWKMRGKHMCFDTNSKLLTQGSSLKNYKAKKKKR